MLKVFQIGARLHKDEEGATAIEYGLLAALIAVVIIGAVSTLGGQLNQAFTGVTAELTGAGGVVTATGTTGTTGD